MATTYNEQIQQLYVAYFNRPADKAGLDYWESVVEAAGGSTAAVSAEFAKSKEYTDAYANMTNAQIVDQVYVNLFGRHAEDAGKKYWADLLDSKAITIDNVVAQVAGGALTTDAKIIANKVAYSQAFTSALDTQAEIDAYAKGGAANVAAKALVAGITTDASLTAAIVPATLNAAVAKVVASVTPFSLDDAVAKVLDAQEAKHDVLVDLAADEQVAEKLGTKPTDAQIEAAVTAVGADAAAAIDAIIAGFSTKSAAMQAALISDAEDTNADALTAANKALTNAKDDVAEVAGLADAIDLAHATADTLEAAIKTADLAANTQASTENALAINTGKAVVLDEVGHTLTVGGTAVVSYSATKGYTLLSTATEAKYPGLTAYVAAINASDKADAAEAKAQTNYTDAFTAADILDSADGFVSLQAVADAMVFTSLGTDELPTYAQILNETDMFASKIEALDAKANAAVAGETYQDALDHVQAAITAAADTAGVTSAINAAVTAGWISSADATAIKAVFASSMANQAAAAAAVDANNFQVHSDDFDAAVANLLAVEDEGVDAGIGALEAAQTGAETAVEGVQTDIEDLADAVAAYDHAVGLQDSVDAADAAIAAAIKVITTEGFAAPVITNDSIILASAKDDIFILGSAADVSLRSMSVQGTDTLFVGTDLTYNSTEIGSGTGQVALSKAGNDSVMEFFLKATSTGVDVIVETKAFGSSEAGTADLITVHLVGVDIDNISVANGFITVAH